MTNDPKRLRVEPARVVVIARELLDLVRAELNDRILEHGDIALTNAFNEIGAPVISRTRSVFRSRMFHEWLAHLAHYVTPCDCDAHDQQTHASLTDVATFLASCLLMTAAHAFAVREQLDADPVLEADLRARLDNDRSELLQNALNHVLDDPSPFAKATGLRIRIDVPPNERD